MVLPDHKVATDNKKVQTLLSLLKSYNQGRKYVRTPVNSLVLQFFGGEARKPRGIFDSNTQSSSGSSAKTIQHFQANPASYAGYPVKRLTFSLEKH